MLYFSISIFKTFCSADKIDLIMTGIALNTDQFSVKKFLNNILIRIEIVRDLLNSESYLFLEFIKSLEGESAYGPRRQAWFSDEFCCS